MSAETIDLYLICTCMQSLNRGTDAVPSKNGKIYQKMSRNNAKKVLGTNETHGTHYSARGKSSVPGRVLSQAHGSKAGDKISIYKNVLGTRRVSDEVFRPIFCEIFGLAEDSVTAAKWWVSKRENFGKSAKARFNSANCAEAI